MNLMASIIIPVYNAAAFLRRCLDSALNQSRNDIEILCVNDCSTDESLSILQKYESDFEGRLIVLDNETNVGGGASRERALRHARGEYVFFLDSDDFLEPDYVETYLDAVADGGLDVIVGGYTKDFGDHSTAYPPVEGAWGLTTYSISCAKMYRRSFLIENKIRYSGIRCGEDILFGMNLFVSGARFRMIDYCGYHYYYNVDSTTNRMTADMHMERNIVAIFDEFEAERPWASLGPVEQDVIEYTYLANMINALIVYGRGCGLKEMRRRLKYFHSDVARRFPRLLDNRFVGILKPKGQTTKIRLSVGIFSFLDRLGLVGLICYPVSL